MSTLELMPFEEAVQYWEKKTPLTKDEFGKLAETERQRAFTVSGIAKQDVLAEIHKQIGKAVKDGMSFEDFKKSDVWEKAGFKDKGYRIDNIFRTNVQSALNAGRYERDIKSHQEYWQYSAVNDSRTRPTHAALDGKVFHRNDPFWQTWYPPNGYRCRCEVIALSKRQLDKEGLKPETEWPTAEVVDKETGEVRNAKMKPDPGFAGSPAAGLAQLSPAEVDGIKDLTDRARCPRDFADTDNCKPPLRNIDMKHVLPFKAENMMPAGLKPEKYVEAFMAEFGLDIDESRVITVPGVRLPFVISKELFIDKQTRKWKVEKSGRERYVRLLAHTIIDPYEVWTVPAEVAGKPMPVARLIRLFQTDNGKIGGFGVFNLAGSRYLPSTVFTPKIETGSEKLIFDYLEKQRVGVLAYREQ